MARTRRPILTRANADKHDLYERAVQSPDAEIEFVDRTYRKLRGRSATLLREDFCGTAASACEWVRTRKSNRAVAVDLDRATLDNGVRRHVSRLTPEQQSRLTLLCRDVRKPSGAALGVDIVLAMNFSYWVFKTRDALRGYFQTVRKSLTSRGIFFLDHYGGSDSYLEITERRRIGGPRRGFVYVWDQARYNPLTAEKTNHIHFEFHRGPAWRRAFTYDWRLWSLVEVRELLAESGFRKVTVFWEGDDGKGSGNGIFRATERGEACRCYIAYICAEK
jgi:hypothetical protein